MKVHAISSNTEDARFVQREGRRLPNILVDFWLELTKLLALIDHLQVHGCKCG